MLLYDPLAWLQRRYKELCHQKTMYRNCKYVCEMEDYCFQHQLGLFLGCKASSKSRRFWLDYPLHKTSLNAKPAIRKKVTNSDHSRTERKKKPQKAIWFLLFDIWFVKGFHLWGTLCVYHYSKLQHYNYTSYVGNHQQTKIVQKRICSISGIMNWIQTTFFI